MPLAFWSLLGIGIVAIALSVAGVRRGRAVAIPPLDVRRSEAPAPFWAGVGFQALIGSGCLLAAIDEIAPFGFADAIAVIVGP